MTLKAARNQRYYLRHRERILAENLAAYRADPETRRNANRAWREDNQIRYQFSCAKHSAKRVKVIFDLSLEEFAELWGSDLGRIGRTNGSLRMFRFRDAGTYTRDNVYIATLSEHSAGARL